MAVQSCAVDYGYVDAFQPQADVDVLRTPQRACERGVEPPGGEEGHTWRAHVAGVVVQEVVDAAVSHPRVIEDEVGVGDDMAPGRCGEVGGRVEAAQHREGCIRDGAVRGKVYLEPMGAEERIVVEKDHDVASRGGDTPVACPRRPSSAWLPQMPEGEGGGVAFKKGGGVVAGGIVHHHDLEVAGCEGLRFEMREAQAQHIHPVAGGDDHRECGTRHGVERIHEASGLFMGGIEGEDAFRHGKRSPCVAFGEACAGLMEEGLRHGGRGPVAVMNHAVRHLLCPRQGACRA